VFIIILPKFVSSIKYALVFCGKCGNSEEFGGRVGGSSGNEGGLVVAKRRFGGGSAREEPVRVW
jgi:3-isopropylmalate dehydratase small subunit